MNLKRSLLRLACVAAVGAFAVGAQAQYSAPGTSSSARSGATPGSPSPADASSPMAPGAITTAPDATTLSTPKSANPGAADQAEADFQAAQENCNAQSGAERDACLRAAQENYDRSMSQGSDQSNEMEQQTSPGSTTGEAPEPTAPSGASPSISPGQGTGSGVTSQ